MEEKLIETLGFGVFLGLIFVLMLIHCLWCRCTVAKDTITISDKGMVVSYNCIALYGLYDEWPGFKKH